MQRAVSTFSKPYPRTMVGSLYIIVRAIYRKHRSHHLGDFFHAIVPNRNANAGRRAVCWLVTVALAHYRMVAGHAVLARRIGAARPHVH